MKFGLFFELSVPRPWTRESERTVYNNALEQVKLADELASNCKFDLQGVGGCQTTPTGLRWLSS